MSEFYDGPYAFPAGSPPYESYADVAPASAVSQYPESWQPDYPHYPPRRPAGETAGHPAPSEAGQRRGYPPAGTGSWPEASPASVAGYRQDTGNWPGPPPPPRRDSGPQPVYRRDSGPQPAYQDYVTPPAGYRQDTGSRPAYRPDSAPSPAPRRDSGPQPAYQHESGPNPAYRRDSGPYPAYQHDTGPIGTAPPPSELRHPPSGSTLLAGPALERPERPQRPASRPSGEQAALGPLLTVGKRVPGWLPYASRLVLLPPGLALEGLEEELREHRDVNGGWLRPAVFGAMDGLVTNSSLIAGIGGGGGGAGMIVLTGIAGLIAGAFSMATGEYISVKSQNELTAAEVDLERRQHARDPRGKRARLTQLFIDKGVSPNLAEAVVRQISADPDRAVATHVREELGIDPDDLPSPRTAAVASLASFTVGALIPLAPFLVGVPSLAGALVLAGGAAFAGGAAVARLAGRSPWLGGLRQFGAAFLATAMSFGVGTLIGAHLG